MRIWDARTGLCLKVDNETLLVVASPAFASSCHLDVLLLFHILSDSKATVAQSWILLSTRKSLYSVRVNYIHAHVHVVDVAYMHACSAGTRIFTAGEDGDVLMYEVDPAIFTAQPLL